MFWTNFHNHCYFDDGTGTPEEHVEEAIQNNVEVLGFSCHASLPFETSWTMNKDTQKEYPAAIRSLQKKYEDKIQILLGLEIDYIHQSMGPYMSEYKDMGLDYSIGSVHHIGSMHNIESVNHKQHNISEEYIPVDGSEKMLEDGINRVYQGNVRKAVEEYYTLVQEMAILGGFDILGHLDLIKKNNKNNRFFSEDEKWYKDIVMDTITRISKSGFILEVNTGGMTRKYIDTTYPSPWILKECLKLGIPITLNSDSHSPDNITAWFKNTAASLLDIGYKEIHVYGENGWKPRKLTVEGLK
ncbi:MAG TPA: histidinol-phosphatase [Clostridiales bacterium]|nr:histidinol-phosphatase [Clostridiales bacterium]